MFYRHKKKSIRYFQTNKKKNNISKINKKLNTCQKFLDINIRH